MHQNYQYYVEGKDEERILKVLKTDFQCIIPGKVEIFNVITKKFTRSKLVTLQRDTIVILVFDTDTNDSSILRTNIEFLLKESMIKHVICVPQVKNLEDELIRSCNIRRIRELLSSRTDSDFKTDLCNCNGLQGTMQRHDFRIDLLWSGTPMDEFAGIPNNSNSIKK